MALARKLLGTPRNLQLIDGDTDVFGDGDVVVTVTPARGAIVMNEWIAPGTHIAALGADKGGDQELDPRSCSGRASSSTISANAGPTER